MAAYIIKADPIDLSDQQVLITAPRFKGAAPSAGDEVFVWFSETAGGAGLAALGSIVAATDGDPITLGVRVEQRLAARSFGKADLAPSRDTGDGPIHGLAAKLYRHSLNKVAELSDAEADLLRDRYEGSAQSGKYSALERWLARQKGTEFTVSFDELERATGIDFPHSAARPQWWANTRSAHTNVQREAWRRAGYDAFLIAGERSVRFVRTRT